MNAIPAVDVRGGRCVQLVGGRPEDEPISLPDPVAAARRWWEAGFGSLHLVDLDAALGSGDNLSVMLELAVCTPAVTQVGGGVRDDARADALLAGGTNRVVVAADTLDAYVVRKGWTETSALTISDFLQRLEGLPLAGVLTTDVGKEGRMGGVNRDAVARILRWSTFPVWISGGVTTEDDLAFLEDEGAEGAVLGMALYTGALDAERVAARWGGRHPLRGSS